MLSVTSTQDQIDDWTNKVESAEEERLKGNVEKMKVYDVDLPDSM